MLDRDGFRPNVGIVLVNEHDRVFLGHRARRGGGWQFPQGGIEFGEVPEQAMFRELKEEIGLSSEHVDLIGQILEWLRYEVPPECTRRASNGRFLGQIRHRERRFRGQKQIWFLLRLIASDTEIRLCDCSRPEFDSWRWCDYWRPLTQVIEFKRQVYEQALSELSNLLTLPDRQQLDTFN